jgi:hypothetical protein
MRRLLFIALLSFTLGLLASTAGAGAKALKCFSTNETGASLYLQTLDNGFIVGDICVDDCGCGPILGEAHVADLGDKSIGTIDFFADLPESCAFGIWYSVALPDLSYIWFSTGLDSTSYSGTGVLKEVACTLN